jgi:hypothetical protein
MVKDNNMLGEFELTGIPKAPRGSAVQVHPGLTVGAWFQRLKLHDDGPVSDFAYNFNLRRYGAG